MADPFAPSSDPDIPTPSREDLLPHVHGSVREQLRAGILESRHAETEWNGARREWDEGHKRRAEEARGKAESERSTKALDSEPSPPDSSPPVESQPELREPPQIKLSEIPPAEREFPATQRRRPRNIEKELLDALKRAERRKTQEDLERFTESMGFRTAGLFPELPARGSEIRRKEPAQDSESPPANHIKKQSWISSAFNRIPVWKEFGPWLKWASACFAFALGMTQINEYGWALAGLAACGVCCLAQIFVWPASPNRFKNGIAKCFLAFLSLGIILIGGLTVIRIKGERQWSNLLPNKPLASPSPTPLQNSSPLPSVQQSESPEPELGHIDSEKVIIDRKGVAVRVGKTILYPQIQLEYDYPRYRFVIYVDNTNLTKDVCLRLLNYFPQLKVEMLKGIERSGEYYPELRYEVSKSKLVINHKGRLTKEQIQEVKQQARKLNISLTLEGPPLP